MDDAYVHLKQVIEDLGIYTYGIADVEEWGKDPLVASTVPEGRRPVDILPQSRSAIVIGIPIQPSVLATSPSIYYRELYRNVNSILDSSTQRIVMELEHMGYAAAFIPRDGYHGIAGLQKDPTSFFSHKHAAYLAGLGTFGVNNTILTERYGPRIRFATVLTDAVLPYGHPMEKGLCTRCMRCREVCPKSAIGDDIYPSSRIDKRMCLERSAELSEHGVSPCGMCIRVCPVGEDKVIPPSDRAIEIVRSYRL